MEQNPLHIIERKATENSQAAIEPDIFRESKGAHGSCREDQRSESRHGDDRYTGEEGTTEVEVFFLLGGCAHERDGAHHCDGVEAGAGDNGGRSHEEERCDEGSLSDVEASPEGVFLDVAGTC